MWPSGAASSAIYSKFRISDLVDFDFFFRFIITNLVLHNNTDTRLSTYTWKRIVFKTKQTNITKTFFAPFRFVLEFDFVFLCQIDDRCFSKLNYVFHYIFNHFLKTQKKVLLSYDPFVEHRGDFSPKTRVNKRKKKSNITNKKKNIFTCSGLLKFDANSSLKQEKNQSIN